MTKQYDEALVIIQMDKDLKYITEQCDSIQKELDAATFDLNIYRAFGNAVDDYFEYRCKSEEDQTEVHRLLERLTDLLTGEPK